MADFIDSLLFSICDGLYSAGYDFLGFYDVFEPYLYFLFGSFFLVLLFKVFTLILGLFDFRR